MKQEFSRRSLLKTGAALLAAQAVPVWAQAKPTLRFAAVFSDKDIRADMIRMLTKDVAGDFTIEPYYGGTLYKQGTELVALQRDNLELSNVAPQDFSKQIPEWSIMTAAYLFRDPKHLNAFFASDLGAQMKKLSPALKVEGIGVNFGCASGVLPSYESLSRFVAFGEALEAELGYKLNVYSGGATTRSLLSLDKNLFPPRVNNLRIGEGYLLGSDKSSGVDIDWLRQDTMELEAELVEIRTKPTVPIGEVGFDAFGGKPVFEDRGRRKRGILAVGRQDVRIEGLEPLDQNVHIITASSDHLLVDIEDCGQNWRVGDILRFRPDYGAMLSLSTSQYITKIYEA